MSDDVVRSAIFDNPAFEGPDGRFDRSLFNQVLMMNQLTEDQLVARLRRDIPRTDLLQASPSASRAPPGGRYALSLPQREAGRRRSSPSRSPAPDPGQPSEADLQKFYEPTPTCSAPPNSAASPCRASRRRHVAAIEIPEDRLKKEYEERKDEFDTAEQREVEQIMAPSEEKAKEGEAALAAGKDFKEVAKEVVGQDPETIELGSLKREEMPRELGDIAFDLPVGKPSDPVKTPLGWHILRVVKIEPAHDPDLGSGQGQALRRDGAQEALDRIDRLANKIDDALAGGAPLAEVADKFGMKLTTVAASDLGGRDAEGKPVMLPVARSEVLKTAFDLGNGETSRVTASQDGAIYAVHVDKVMPTMVKPLAEVKDQAVTAWQAEQKHAAVLKEAEELAARGQAGCAARHGGGRKEADGHDVAAAAAAAGGGQYRVAGAGREAVWRQARRGGDRRGRQRRLRRAAQGNPERRPAGGKRRLRPSKRIGELEPPDLAGEFTTALRNRFKVEIHRDAVDRIF